MLKTMKQDNQNDSIHICGLRLKCHIGVTARERRKRQAIMADIALKCDLSRAEKSDRLEGTIDYAVLAKKIFSLAAGENFCLLEALAGRIADICLADSKARAVKVKVAKKGVLPNVSSVEVEITHSRDFNVCHSRLDRESRNSEKTGFPLARK